MRDSIFYSALRALATAFCAVLGIGLGLVFFTIFIGLLSTGTADTKLTSKNTEEILPNAEGKREIVGKDSPIILQINIEGIIGTEHLDTKTIRRILVESREGDYKSDRVKALLVYINTPGGTVTDADGIYRALIEYKKLYKVPIFAYVDGLCASGGMYVASAADKIYASDTSLIGSVGVIAPTFMNFTKLLEKIGVDTLTLSAGKDKDAMNPLRPWKPDEDKNYREIVDYYYDHFVNIVTHARPEVSKERLVQDYGANIFPAPGAKERGLIDVSNGSLSRTIEALVKQANIEGDYQVIKLESKDWWNTLFSSENSFLKGIVKHTLQLTPEWDPALQNQFLYLYRP